MPCHYIASKWREGLGEEFVSKNPATQEILWSGREGTKEEVDEAVGAAKESFALWSHLSLEERVSYLHLFETQLKGGALDLAEAISKGCGKPLWEAKQEVSSMVAKVALSIEAFTTRCNPKKIELEKSHLHIHCKPHGVVAVLGPFNFPGHLPNGHIVPALLAGNTVVFKGSELTPGVSELMMQYWSDLPKGVINLVQGGAMTGHHLTVHPDLNGLLFTGSYSTGFALLDAFKSHPEKILALEMGGNNPLVICDISDLEAAAYSTILSAFLTSGQRCTCARRLIIPEGREGDEFLKILVQMSTSIQIAPYNTQPEPFMGPVISLSSAHKLLNEQALLGSQGGVCLLEMSQIWPELPFLKPGIMDVTQIHHRKDEELFGPFLQVIRVPSFEAAIAEANRTMFGLCASLFSRSKEKFLHFYQTVNAGVINWNTPTTGASSKAPFGGIGKSGNFRPSGFYASDYCSYPVASMQSDEIYLPTHLTPGITLLARM